MSNISNPDISEIIVKYNVSARSENILKSSGIENLQELINYYNQYGTFSKIRNCGEKSNHELTELITKLIQEENINIYESVNLLTFGFDRGDKQLLSRKGIHSIHDLRSIPLDEYNKLPRLTRFKIRIFIHTEKYFTTKNIIQNRLKEENKIIENKNVLKQLDKFLLSENTDIIYNKLPYDLTFDLCIQIISTYTEKVLSNLIIPNSSSDDKQVISLNRNHLKKLLLEIKDNLILISDFYDEITAYYENSDKVKKEIIQLFINTQKYAIIEIGKTCHIIPFHEINQYQKIIKSIQKFPEIKPANIQISQSIANDTKFLYLLNLHFDIIINNVIISNNPPINIQDKIYYFLRNSQSPLSFQSIIEKFGIPDVKIASIRALITRDPRILHYGKLGILGLAEYANEIDNILSQSVAQATLDLIKIHKLQCCTFETVKILYETINKEISQNSWRSNIQLSTNDLFIKKDAAFTRENYLDTKFIRTVLNDIHGEITKMIEGEFMGNIDTLARNLIIFNNSNIPDEFHNLTIYTKQLIVTNRADIEKEIIEKSIKFNPNLFRYGFGFHLKYQKRTEQTLDQITQDGFITYPENVILTNSYNESDFNKRLIKNFLENFVVQKRINIDEQILHVFEYNNWHKCTINELKNELFRLYLGVEIPSHMIIQCKIIKIVEQNIYFDNSNYHKVEHELEIIGTKFRIELIQSLFENVHFEYDLNVGQDRIFVRYKKNSNLENIIYIAVISILIEQNNHSLNSILKRRQQISDSIKILLNIQL
jgi:hypothetical protein